MGLWISMEHERQFMHGGDIKGSLSAHNWNIYSALLESSDEGDFNVIMQSLTDCVLVVCGENGSIETFRPYGMYFQRYFNNLRKEKHPSTNALLVVLMVNPKEFGLILRSGAHEEVCNEVLDEYIRNYLHEVRDLNMLLDLIDGNRAYMDSHITLLLKVVNKRNLTSHRLDALMNKKDRH